jgi:hypothetical protein
MHNNNSATPVKTIIPAIVGNFLHNFKKEYFNVSAIFFAKYLNHFFQVGSRNMTL